jgi:hypothetical protein
VALLGVGSLGMVSMGLLAGLPVSSPLHTAFGGLAAKNRLLAAVPLGLYLFRVLLLLSAARFSPSLRDLGAVFKIGRCSVRGKSGSAKAPEVEAGQRPVPPRVTPGQLGFPLTRRAHAEPRFILKTAPGPLFDQGHERIC